GRDDLGEALRLLHGARTAAGEEREDTDLVGTAARLHLLLGLSHPGDLGRGVDYRRHSLVVDLAEAAGNEVGDHHALLLALVRQHGAAHAIAHGPDAFGARAALVVDLDEAALVQLDASARRQKISRVRPAADRDEQPVDRECLLALGVRVGDLDRASREARSRSPTRTPRASRHSRSTGCSSRSAAGLTREIFWRRALASSWTSAASSRSTTNAARAPKASGPWAIACAAPCWRTRARRRA